MELDDDEDPNENVGAAFPLGDPLLGTAAPNENAVEGDVEGGLALNENPENGLEGVVVVADVDAFSDDVEVAGADGLAEGVEVDAPKLNPVDAGLGGSSFLLSSDVEAAPKLKGFDDLFSEAGADIPGAPNENGDDFFVSPDELESDLEGTAGALPNVNGDELELPEVTVGTNPVPAGVDDEDPAVGGFNEPKKPDVGTEGGLGIDRPAAGAEVVPDPLVEVVPFDVLGFQPDDDAISSMYFDACSPSGPRTFDKSRNGSSLMASDRTLTRDSFIPRTDVQYSISADEGSDDDEAESEAF